MKKSLLFSCIYLLSFLTSGIEAQITKNIYFLGNSVTDAINYSGLEALASERGNTHVCGRHMIPGTPLDNLWNSPAGGFSNPPFGFYPQALGNYTWDVISCQPFDRSVSSDVASISSFANLALTKSPDVQIYIYSRWHRFPSGKTIDDPTLSADLYNQLWTTTTPPGYEYEYRGFFESLCVAVRAALPAIKPALMVPVGEVFYELNKKMALGQVPGYTRIWETYSDGIHQKGVGSYIAACTFYATMYKQSPLGLDVPTDFGPIPDDVKTIIQQTVQDVVFSNAYSGCSSADLIPPSGVEVLPATATINVLESKQLNAKIMPVNAANKQLAWSSSNTSVAVVSKNGLVTGVSNGTCNITATTNVGKLASSCAITVNGTLAGTTTSGVLDAWDFANTTNGLAAYNATTVMDGVVNSPVPQLTVASGLSPMSYQKGCFATQQTTTNITASIAQNEYMSFTVTPVMGKLLTINKITFYGYSQNQNRTFSVLSSVNGFTDSKVIGTFTCNSTVTPSVVNLTGHVNLTEPVEFRIYMYGPVNSYESVGFTNAAGNDVIVEGSLFTVADNTPPTAPLNFKAAQVKDVSMNLTWDASTDNVVVWGYNVYKDGIKLNSALLKDCNYPLSGLISGKTYHLEISAVDYSNNESVRTAIDVMTNRPPVAVIGANAVNTIPFTMKFNADGSTDPDNDMILGFTWDFGDGSAIDVSNSPSHTYSKAGDYTVTLKVMDYREMYSALVSKKITVSNVTAISQPGSEQVSIYPNPVNSGVVTLKTEVSSGGNIIVDIFDITGKPVQSVQRNLIGGTLQLNISTLASGTYIVSVKGANITQKLRMVVK